LTGITQEHFQQLRDENLLQLNLRMRCSF